MVAIVAALIGTGVVQIVPPATTPSARPPTPTQAPMPTPTLAVGRTMVREKDGMAIVYVPGGSFEMGSRQGASDAQPAHAVRLDGFWIDRTEATNAEYAGCVAGGACSSPSLPGSFTRQAYYGESRFGDYPVLNVSWTDADTYCRWAGGGLPSEAEWEYAARGPDGRVYPWGNAAPDDSLLNYDHQVGDTTQVGAYPEGASWVGALDMAGNVWEWVGDWYDYAFYASSPAQNPRGPETGELKVLRGGGWGTREWSVRAAARYYAPPDTRAGDIGFRCVGQPDD